MENNLRETVEGLQIMMKIGGGVAVILAGFFGWVIILIRGQNRGTVNAIKAEAELNNRISILETEMKSVQKNYDGTSKKLEDLASNVALLNATVMENGVITRALKAEIDKVEGGIKTLDQKMDNLILNLSKFKVMRKTDL